MRVFIQHYLSTFAQPHWFDSQTKLSSSSYSLSTWWEIKSKWKQHIGSGRPVRDQWKPSQWMNRFWAMNTSLSFHWDISSSWFIFLTFFCRRIYFNKSPVCEIISSLPTVSFDCATHGFKSSVSHFDLELNLWNICQAHIYLQGELWKRNLWISVWQYGSFHNDIIYIQKHFTPPGSGCCRGRLPFCRATPRSDSTWCQL